MAEIENKEYAKDNLNFFETNAQDKKVDKVKWKNPTKQKIEVTLDGRGLSFAPGEVITFDDGLVTFGKNTRLIKV